MEDQDREPFWLSAPSYWQPAHIVTSAWLTHAPFAFWLLDNLRPRAVAELGSHFGFSTFTFAEASRRLRTPMTIHAVDTWQGDDHAGFYGEDVHEAFLRIVRSEYADLIRPMRQTFAAARSDIPDASVQLLHIDGRHGYEDVLEDFQGWRTAVDDGGIVLFHDIAERQPGFGVWRLWEELADRHPSFAFEHGHGLGVLAVGEPATPELRALFAADGDEAKAIRADYERLGAVVGRQSRLEGLPAVVASDLRRIAQQEHAIAELRKEVDERERDIATIHASTSWRVTGPLRSLGRARDRLRTPR